MFELVRVAPFGQNTTTGKTTPAYRFSPTQNCIVHGFYVEPLDHVDGQTYLMDTVNENFQQLIFGIYQAGQPIVPNQLIRNFMTVPAAVTGNMNDWDTGFNHNSQATSSEVGPYQTLIRPVPLSSGVIYLIMGLSSTNDLPLVPDPTAVIEAKSLRLVVEYVDAPMRWVKMNLADMSVALDAGSLNTGGGVTKCFELHANGAVRAIEVRIPHDKATSENGTGAGVPALYYRNYPYGDAYQDALASTDANTIPRGVARYPWSIPEESSGTVMAQKPNLGMVVMGGSLLAAKILETLWSPSVPNNYVRSIPVYPVINTYIQRWYLGEMISNVFTPMTAARLEATGAQVWALIQE